MAQAFPLQWPNSVPRCARPQKAAFGYHSLAQAVAELRKQVSLLGPRYLTISTNVPLRQDGLPYSNPGRIQDPGVACYFRLDDADYCLPCDRWQTVEHNVWAIAKHIDAMRGMRRWGVGTAHQAFAGYKALAAKSGRDWWDVLRLSKSADRGSIETQFRYLSKTAHPDTPTGSHEVMAELNQAREQALAEVGR